MDNVISLQDEQGNDIFFEFLDLIGFMGKEYVVLLPCDTGSDEAEEVIILELVDIDSMDQESYVGVDDEEILNSVYQLFKERAKDLFEFAD